MSVIVPVERAAPNASSTPPVRRRRVGLARITALLGAALVFLLVFHTTVPDVAGLGLVVDTALPWLGLAVPLLLVGAFVARSRAAIATAVLSALVWGIVFVPSMVPLSWTAAAPSDSSLTVASQNVEAGSGTAADSAAALAATGAEVVALQEMDAESRDAAGSVLDAIYPYRYGVGTVGVWSVFPIENAQMLDLGLGWKRGLAADLETPSGPVSIYVVHAASARPAAHDERDAMLANLADHLARDENDRVIAIGDFNAGSSDRALGAVTAQLSEANQSEGGFGFTWPAVAPVVRLDHVFQRGMEVVSNTTVAAGGGDHLAVVATLDLQ
ncbi:endonuclease/exonuclease/phosphatase family protein [Agromyces cerinus]|uniref:Vancomycin resistance protein VanJ n=1 Tax=Agromyces cerinus subsp. cerinus TaxID=232089 RepID=A0A1N6GGM5_9MICO|nr:endonuclease/exonuclease/phosphatase family protein [Agromyces cerinus]SIO06611.1 vancomycin resistance protein VanJ [Agromyces cerinus subsp. cerinus]